MADLSNILPNTIRPGDAGRSANRRPDSLRTAEDARIRAGAVRQGDSPRVQKALARLDRVLDSGQEPNSNVPRGYYINIEV